MEQPGAFYKYLSVKGTESVLRSGVLRWSSPLLFDDPAEFQQLPRFSPSVQDSGGKFVETLIDLAAGAPRLNLERFSPRARLLLEHLRRLVKSGILSVNGGP